MVYAGIAVALVLLGAVVGLVGRKIGTALALAPVAAWLILFVQAISAGTIDGPRSQELAVWLVIGLVAFMIGQGLTSRHPLSRPRGQKDE